MLKPISLSTIELIDTHNPDEVAIEAPFFKCAVMLEVGRAQGVAMAAALERYPITGMNLRKLKWLLLEMEMPLRTTMSTFRAELPKPR
jgi:crossover junction endodeoxyribonuclease RuvC